MMPRADQPRVSESDHASRYREERPADLTREDFHLWTDTPPSRPLAAALVAVTAILAALALIAPAVWRGLA